MTLQHTVLLRRNPRIAREIDNETVRELKDIACRRVCIPCQTGRFQHFTKVAADKSWAHAVRVDRRYGRNHDPTELPQKAQTRQLQFIELNAVRFQLIAEEAAHLAARHDRRLFGKRDIDGICIRRGLHRDIRLAAGPGTRLRLMTNTLMVAVHMADQQDVDFAETRVVRTGNRPAGTIENPCSARVFEDHRPVELTELAVLEPQACYFTFAAVLGCVAINRPAAKPTIANFNVFI